MSTAGTFTHDGVSDPAESRSDPVATLDRLVRVQRDLTRSRVRKSELGRERAELVDELHYEHGMSYRAIARQLGVSHNALTQYAGPSRDGRAS